MRVNSINVLTILAKVLKSNYTRILAIYYTLYSLKTYVHLDVKLTLHTIADLPDENNHLDRPGTIRLSSNKTTRQNAATSL